MRPAAIHALIPYPPAADRRAARSLVHPAGRQALYPAASSSRPAGAARRPVRQMIPTGRVVPGRDRAPVDAD